jgi:serine/threonine protein kinase
MPDGRPLKPGDPARLGLYTLTGRLGEGGQGVVYLGESESGDQVAVKLLHADLANDDTARARFLRELDAVKRVARFCTAQVLDADVEGDRPYIVSEYVQGPSLHQLVSSGSPRSGADLERLAIGTVTALVAIHQAGIIHRDFKPQNVLIGPDGPRVIDFGIARALDAAATMTNSTIGTPAYMAPEQLTAKELTPAADLFSWASTMVFAATGQAPFGQDTVMAVIHRIMNEPPDLGSMEEPLRGIVAGCLAKDPVARPQTQGLLMRLLGEEGLTPSAPAADPQTAIMDQGAAFARASAAADLPPTQALGPARPIPPTGALPPAGATEATRPAGTGRTRTTRAALAALAGLLVAAGVIAAVVWASSRGNDHPSKGGGAQTPVPSSAPATSEEPSRPVQPTHRRQSAPPPASTAPEPSTSPPTTPPTTPTDPGGGTSDPGGDTPDPGAGGGSAKPGDGDGGTGDGGGVTQPAAQPT